MYETLKNVMPAATYFYGPVTKHEAFTVGVASYATTVNNDWYVGTLEEVGALTGKNIPQPIELTEEIITPESDSTISDSTN